MIDFKVLEKLLDLLNRSEADTIEIRKRFWGTSIRVSKNSSMAPPGPQQAPGPHPPAGNPALAGPPAGEMATAAEGGGAEPRAPARELVEIKSPMVGTFYAQPEPGAEPYVTVGSRISPGQTLCIIEAMKIMNPLDAEVSGVIAERLVEDAQPVEFGQPLFRVDPHG